MGNKIKAIESFSRNAPFYHLYVESLSYGARSIQDIHSKTVFYDIAHNSKLTFFNHVSLLQTRQFLDHISLLQIHIFLRVNNAEVFSLLNGRIQQASSRSVFFGACQQRSYSSPVNSGDGNLGYYKFAQEKRPSA